MNVVFVIEENNSMHHLVTTINDLRIYLWSATKVPQRRVARNRVETPFGVVTEIVYFIISNKNHQEFEINTYNDDLAVFGMHVGWGKKARIFEARPSSPDSGRFTEKKVGARRRTPERCIILC
jgi:hypothetical protein